MKASGEVTDSAGSRSSAGPSLLSPPTTTMALVNARMADEPHLKRDRVELLPAGQGDDIVTSAVCDCFNGTTPPKWSSNKSIQ
jgi:hypothetical protein